MIFFSYSQNTDGCNTYMYQYVLKLHTNQFDFFFNHFMGVSELLCETKLLRDLRNCYSMCWSVLIWDTILCNQLKILSFRMQQVNISLLELQGNGVLLAFRLGTFFIVKGLSGILAPTYCRLIVPSSLWQLMLPGISKYPLKYLYLSFLYRFFFVFFFFFFLSFSFSVGPIHSGQVFLILKKVFLALIVPASY